MTLCESVKMYIKYAVICSWFLSSWQKFRLFTADLVCIYIYIYSVFIRHRNSSSPSLNECPAYCAWAWAIGSGGLGSGRGYSWPLLYVCMCRRGARIAEITHLQSEPLNVFLCNFSLTNAGVKLRRSRISDTHDIRPQQFNNDTQFLSGERGPNSLETLLVRPLLLAF